MTNGEKMQEMYPDIEMWGDSKDTLDYSLGGMIHRVTKSWWNAEYTEQTTKNDKIDCDNTDCNNCVNHKYCDYEPTTKSETLISLGVYKQVAWERDIAIQQLHELGYEFGQKIEPTIPHCQCTDAEIAKSFIEDVEAVKDQLPCGEQMDFPNTFDEFAKDYGFRDKKEIYTNGSELIPVFRVKQWLEHISTTKNDLGVREFEGIEVTYPPEDICTYPEYKGKPYFAIQYKENGESIVGYGTYSPEVLSNILKSILSLKHIRKHLQK